MALAQPRPLAPAPDGPAHLRRLRVGLADGAETTVHVAAHPRATTAVRVVALGGQRPLEAWCAERGVQEALVGGFFARPHGTPLGELRTGGIERAFVPFDAPYGALRACVHVEGGEVAIARRDELAARPTGDLLQAGPLLVRDGAPVAGDDEGFSAGAGQFDSDITRGRYPRAALGLTPTHVLAVAVDGRADDDAGLDLAELAEVLVALGARSAMNLDGGGSTSLVCAGRLANVPRESHGIELRGGRPISTALVFAPR